MNGEKTPTFSLPILGGSLLVAFVISGAASPDGPARRSWDFEAGEPGKIAKGFSNEVGQWAVTLDGKNRVLAQEAESEDDAFNVALADGTSYQDMELSVRLKAVAGKNDQGGGVVWRAKDSRNYYIARYIPLETDQADCTPSDRWCEPLGAGYDRRRRAARAGRVVPTPPDRDTRRDPMPATARRITPPRA